MSSGWACGLHCDSRCFMNNIFRVWDIDRMRRLPPSVHGLVFSGHLCISLGNL